MILFEEDWLGIGINGEVFGQGNKSVSLNF